MRMELQILDGEFTVCMIESVEQVDFSREFVFLSKTDNEISLVCESAYAPSFAIKSKIIWRGLKILGELDFGLVGVIAKTTSILANKNISVFVVSTYKTDYIFFNVDDFDIGLQALTDNGYAVI